jgi:hypothetical protein
MAIAIESISRCNAGRPNPKRSGEAGDDRRQEKELMQARHPMSRHPMTSGSLGQRIAGL